jgi:hypothetical protein
VAFLIGFYLLWAAEEYWQLRRLTRGLAIAPPRSVSGTTPDEPKLPYLQRSALMISTRFLLLQCLVFGPIFVYAAHFMIRTGNIGVGSIASAVVLILFPAWATVMLVTKLWMRWIGGEPSVAEAQLAQENKLGMQAYLRMLRPAWILVALLFLLGLAAAFVG